MTRTKHDTATITVNGATIHVTPDTDTDTLDDEQYAELERACDADEHPLGACPLCHVDQLSLSGVSYRDESAKTDLLDDLWGGDRWTGGWHATSSQEARSVLNDKLIRAHAIVRSFVDTFATGDVRYDVTFDPSIGTAGTDFKGKRVVISPAPALDPTLTPGEAGRILTGMSTHEASHVRYDRGWAKAISRAFPNDQTAHTLGNLLADVRIEDRFSREYPGYAHVFPETLAYVAKAYAKGAPVKLDLRKQTALAIAVVRYPAYCEITDETRPESDWWTDWAKRGVARDEAKHAVTSVREALDHIAAVQETDQTATTGPAVVVDIPSCLAEAVVRAAIENGVNERQIDGADAQRVVNLAEVLEGLDPELEAAMKTTSGRGEVRPCSDLPGRARIQVEPSAFVTAAVRDAMLRSRSGRTGVERAQPRGRLDDRSLTRLAFADTHVFHRRTATSPGKYLVYLLVDRSSSMSGFPTQQVVAAAKSIALATRYSTNVRMEVHGWTTPSYKSGMNGVAHWGVYRAWRSGEDVARIGDLGRISEGGTPDAPALAWAIGDAARSAQRGEQPIIVMLSDGMGYGHTTMTPLIERAAKMGVRVVSIAVGYLNPKDQERTYGRGNFVSWKGSVAQSARSLAQMLARITAAESSAVVVSRR